MTANKRVEEAEVREEDVMAVRDVMLSSEAEPGS